MSDTVDDQFQSMIEIDFTHVIPQSSFLEYLGVSAAKELHSRMLWVGLKDDKRDTCKFWEGQVYRVKGSIVRMFFDNEEPQEFSINVLEKLWVEQMLFRSEADLKRGRPGAPVRRLRRSLKGKVPIRQTILAETFSGSMDEPTAQPQQTPDCSTPVKYHSMTAVQLSP